MLTKVQSIVLISLTFALNIYALIFLVTKRYIPVAITDVTTYYLYVINVIQISYICLLVHSYSEIVYLRIILALTKYIKSTCVKFCWGIAIGPLFSAFITLHCFRVLGEPSGWLKARGRGGISTSCWVLREPPIRDRSSMHTGPDSYKQSRITLVLKLNSLMDNLPTPL